MADLPTLFELEHALRAKKVGRATGYDPLSSALYHHNAAALAEHAFPLMLKMWGEEPIQYKGSPMALIPKIPQPAEVKHFRGILLLPTLAKSFHSLVTHPKAHHTPSGSTADVRAIRRLCRPRSSFWVSSIAYLGANSVCQGPQHGCALCGFTIIVSCTNSPLYSMSTWTRRTLCHL